MDLFWPFPTTTAAKNTPASFLALQILRLNVDLVVFDRGLDAMFKALKDPDFVWLFNVLFSRIYGFWSFNSQFIVSISDIPSPLPEWPNHTLSLLFVTDV